LAGHTANGVIPAWEDIAAQLDDEAAELGLPQWMQLIDIAVFLGLSRNTINVYRYRSTHGTPLAFPPDDPEQRVGTVPRWARARVLYWHRYVRPGPGAGGGPKPKRGRRQEVTQ